MIHASLDAFLASQAATLAKGPTALVADEDGFMIVETLRHLLGLGFRQIVVAATSTEPREFLDEALSAKVHLIPGALTREGVAPVVNALMRAANGTWVHVCYNAEFLFYPFAETRRISEITAFNTEERRRAFAGVVLDLYPMAEVRDLTGLRLDTAGFDASGYFALAREDAAKNWEAKERQLNFYGGLRWRFEEFVPFASRRIDRVPLFRAASDLTYLPSHLLSDEEMNTFSCPWHHNLSVAVMSFRTVKALFLNPDSAEAARRGLAMTDSMAFDWTSRQLMDLGFIEPGQWF